MKIHERNFLTSKKYYKRRGWDLSYNYLGLETECELTGSEIHACFYKDRFVLLECQWSDKFVGLVNKYVIRKK